MTTPTATAATDEKAIRALVARASEAQNDTEALTALHTPDVAIVNIAGRRLLGRAEFAAAMTEALASPLRDVRTSVDIRHISRTTPDTAIVSCVKTVHDERGDAAPLPRTGALTYLVVRTEGAWRIALAQTTPILS